MSHGPTTDASSIGTMIYGTAGISADNTLPSTITQKAQRLDALAHEVRARIEGLNNRLWPAPPTPESTKHLVEPSAESLPQILEVATRNLETALGVLEKITAGL